VLEPDQLGLHGDQLGASGEHVVTQRDLLLARRALVMQGDRGAPLDRQLAAVDRRLAGEHPEQRGLARAVAPRQREPVAPLELERDPAQQRRARDVLGQIRCDGNGHPTMLRWAPCPPSGAPGIRPRTGQPPAPGGAA